MKKKFLRVDWTRHSKLGKKRKKKQTWRKPSGRHNKMREKIRGHPVSVSVGYKQSENKRGTLNGKIPKLVANVNELLMIKNNEIAIIKKIGKKKQIEILKLAKEKKIEVYNFNPNKIEKILKLNKKVKEKTENESKK